MNYVTGYTGFHGSDPEQQSGNYLPIKVNVGKSTNVNVTVELTGSSKGPVKLDSDMMFVGRITNKDTQTINIVATKGVDVKSITYSLKKLVCTPMA